MVRRSVLSVRLGVALLIATAGAPGLSAQSGASADGTLADATPAADAATPLASASLPAVALDRIGADLREMARYRPGYTFWQHVFLIPDGSVAFGSATDGRLLVTFPNGGDWTRNGQWADPELASTLAGARLHTRQNLRRDEVALLLEGRTGPVLHNATRGNFLRPNARRYGAFLDEWGLIFERFGVPAEIGLAQAAVESGWNGRIRSEARALGFCQWLPRNWDQMKRFAHHEIEGYNQTTQAPYCAAYLTILATKYGSFIPALSEHHAGGTNIGRTVLNGARLGGEDPREQYLLGSEFARDLRQISLPSYREVVRSYGPRSFLYAEMVFGNAHTVRHYRDTIPQERIHAMRAPRNIPLDEITRRTGLSADQVRRYNPALVRQVPARANLYLPMRVEAFGADVSFWHEPAPAAFAELLEEFLALSHPPIRWDDRSFEPVLQDFRARFRATGTEEGEIMATVLAYVIQEARTSGRGQILADYQRDPRIRRLVELGVRERESFRAVTENATVNAR